MSEHWTWQGALVPSGEPISGRTYRADGWSYRDLPGRKFSPEMWDYFLSLIGEHGTDYVIMACSSGVGRDGEPWVRGQLLISPQGEANMFAAATPRSGDGEGG